MIFLALLFSLAAHADTSITALPLGSAAASGVNDVFPFVDVTTNVTKKMKLSDLKNLPSFSALVFTNGANPFTANQSMGGFKITNALNPTAQQDYATKDYVDLVNPSIYSIVQEAPSGVVDGVNQVFTTSQTVNAAAGMILSVDGGTLQQGGGLDYGVAGNTITLSFAPVVGQKLWAVYNGTLTTLLQWVRQDLTLSGADITAQFKDLAFTVDESSLQLSVQGLTQVKDVDYSLSVVLGVTRITFIGNLATAGSTPLIAGNVLNVQYQH